MRIIRLPLDSLTLPDEQVTLSRVRNLTTEEIRELLRAGPVRFVVANVGAPLNWIPIGDCYDFWKSEVKPRVVDTKQFYLDDFPGGLAFVASLWKPAEVDSTKDPVVLLESHH